MKAISYCVFFCCIAFVSQAADKNFEVLLGPRIGGGWAVQEGNFYRSLSKVSGSDINYTYKGYFIPIGLELAFDIKNIRVGYSLRYANMVFNHNIERYRYHNQALHQTEEGVNKVKQEVTYHYLINSLFFEYAFRIKPKFAIAPSIGIGFIAALSNQTAGVAPNAAINFEIKNKKQTTTFVISPTYIYYTNGKRQSFSGHMASLEVTFRFRLNKKIQEPCHACF